MMPAIRKTPAQPTPSVSTRISSLPGVAGHPSTVFFLTADAFGVLPPIARLTPDQAMYHFLSGYTAKLAGTEKGVGNEPQTTFSSCFGAPFLPLHPRRLCRLAGGKATSNRRPGVAGEHRLDGWTLRGGSSHRPALHRAPWCTMPCAATWRTAPCARILSSASTCPRIAQACQRTSWTRARPGKTRRRMTAKQLPWCKNSRIILPSSPGSSRQKWQLRDRYREILQVTVTSKATVTFFSYGGRLVSSITVS